MAEPMILVAHGAKAKQNFDADPPRCMTCVYFRREPHTLNREVVKFSRKGKPRIRKEPLRKDPILNPIVDRCSFGNFLTKPHAICDEWHSRTGEVIDHG
ncbi:hypothetical protein I5U31_03630 [Stenotrophomonas maltophilia]|uniref:hypothetical protein n=1 Tax=Stenotrophomonas maltophilia TaxID=40324 RepID=UPI001313614C|nr:hypothetical protein [Stenotrophomonas maltophilia]MBH1426081.1 hypothetical protein [Stenotrophomonas maltophilia]UGB21282.1 hypothetical protein LQ335_18875 [Stenotrophomonas maltophilia]